MPRRSRKLRPTKYSRTLVVKTETNEERDLFLQIGLSLLEDINYEIDTRLNRIELDIRGQYDEVDQAIDRLRQLEGSIRNALYPSRDGYYLYHNQILHEVSQPPVNLDLFAAALTVFGFDSIPVDGLLKTEAPLADVIRIHKQIIDLRAPILGEFNRDVERFLIIIALSLPTDDLNPIIDTAIDLGVIQETEYGYQFAVSPQEARKRVVEHLGIELAEQPEAEEGYSDLDLSEFGFDGGKVVFYKDGKEIDPTDIDT